MFLFITALIFMFIYWQGDPLQARVPAARAPGVRQKFFYYRPCGAPPTGGLRA